jgi:glutathione S-transferase
MAPPLKLYSHPVAPNPRRVRIFAAEKGIELAWRTFIFWLGTPEFLAENSSGAVPVLELDDGSYPSESVAICRHLEGLQPEPNLLGRDLREQAEIERWNRRMALELFAQSHARLRIPVRFFKAALHSSRNTVRRSAGSFISVLNGWIRNWRDMSSLRSTALRSPILPP